MTYTATITSASLRVRESRVVAELLLQGASAEEWQAAMFENNVLQMSSQVSVRRISRLLRARLEPLGAALWALVRDGSLEQATQAVFAAAVKESRLLADFMDLALREQRTLFATHLEPRVWTEYIQGCRGRDPDMPLWTESTVRRLRSAVFSMLAEAGYLENTRTRRLQNVFLDEALESLLRAQDETHLLRCLKVTE